MSAKSPAKINDFATSQEIFNQSGIDSAVARLWLGVCVVIAVLSMVVVKKSKTI